MKKENIYKTLILGLSLIISLGMISISSVRAGINNPGNNHGVSEPINTGDVYQAKSTALGLPMIYDSNNLGYYLDPSYISKINRLSVDSDSDFYGNAELHKTNTEINNVGDLSLVNKRYVDTKASENTSKFHTAVSIASSGTNTTNAQSNTVELVNGSDEYFCAITQIDSEFENSGGTGSIISPQYPTSARVYRQNGRWYFTVAKDVSETPGRAFGEASCFKY